MALADNLELCKHAVIKTVNEVTMADAWRGFIQLLIAARARTSRRIRLLGATLLFLLLTVYLSRTTLSPHMPTVSLTYRQRQQQASKFNETKVALLIENRPFPILAPLTLHFISVVPPDWRFRFMGSPESVAHMNRSVAIREQVAAGKLDLTHIPSNMSTGSQEEISRFLTTLWLYETVLRPAEHLLIFQTDSILCANSRQTLNDFVGYDWVGAPWNPNGKYGGNGGLSLRRVSTIVDILRHQQRIDGSEPEDVWLTDRLAHRPGARLANGTVSGFFSGEMHSGAKTYLDVVSSSSSSTGDSDSDPDGNGNGNGQTNDEKAPPILYSGAGKDRNETRAYNSTLEAAKDGAYVAGIDNWRVGQYEPMGYHTGGSGTILHGAVWGTPEMRRHIWSYCPEVKMTLQMDAAKYVRPGCEASWRKRGLEGEGGVEMETEVIDGVEYPILPPNLVPW